MAIYRCEAKAISRGQGRSCVAAAAYRHAERLRDERQQMTHSYERKEGVTHSEIIAPDGAPEWARNREQLWNHIDEAEKRKDAMTAREVLVALPRELNHEQRVEAVRAFCREEFTSRGIVADVAIHEPDARDGEKQPHAHIMVSDRALDASQPTGLAAKKDRTLSQAEGIEALRERWGHHCNRALERAHVPERVDHRSLADQRQAVLVVAADNTRSQAERRKATEQAFVLNRPPEPKIGPVAMQMDREGNGDKAHALRDAMAVREDRTMLARVVESWHQVRQQMTELRQVIEAKARDLVGKVLPDRRDELMAAANSPETAKAADLLGQQQAERILQQRAADRAAAEQRARIEAQRKQQEQQRQQETQRQRSGPKPGRDGPSFGR
ncbi:MAG: MobA/MobL family protein [Nitrospirae bacterium]|nr:MobA/MobL family protein [Nitrospirota bacterium]MBF0477363.1 MobA/MobL family protein [Deltaproteobacteria bacterium]